VLFVAFVVKITNHEEHEDKMRRLVSSEL